MLKPLVLSLALLASITGAQAAVVIGGSSLLTTGYANQLEAWLGEGPITLTNLYTKQAGHTSANFHAAVDGQGRTFVVMQATENYGNGATAVIGGYNNVSWNNTSTYTQDFNLFDGDNAFLFNLSTGAKLDQTNAYATYNTLGYGPTFGGGHDIYVDNSLNAGYSYRYSFGTGSQGISVIDGSYYNGHDVRYGAIEVFTINAGTPSIPEPSSLALIGAALAAATAATRRRH